MRESGYFPAGAEFDPSAPYNEPIIPEKKFDVTCSQSISKTTTVITNNYVPGAEWCEYDDGITIGGYDPDNTSDTDWSEEYHLNDHYTPIQLIGLFKQHLENELNRMGDVKDSRRIKHLIEECSDWTEDETEYIEG